VFGDNGGMPVATDEYVPAALDRLHVAVAGLADPCKETSSTAR
jgi:hypothetical protein